MPITFVETGPNEAPITELFAFISVDDKGNEGICATAMGDGVWLAMVTSKQRIAEMMKPAAEDIARQGGKTVKLIRMSARAELWQTNPNRYKRSEK